VSSDPRIADPNSEVILLQVEQPYANHNGGGLTFGPDGYLYIGLGDGGSGGDPQGNAQNYLTLLGKMLRIDVDNGTPYAIPQDNPYIALSSRLGQIWATGLRNPWRFSFDRLTGDLYIGDVGQNQWEEINFLPAGAPGGANFGWDYFEGFHSYEGAPAADLELVSPIIEYRHSGGSCSVTGGYVYRGQALPEWFGVYLFGDYCSGIVWGAIQNSDGSWQTEMLFNLPYSISSFGEDEDGELYLVDFNGSIYRLERK
jgi:glucose/arabinose dehydrogenase